MNYEDLFARPAGRTARGAYLGAMLTLLAAFVFYWLWVTGRTGQFAMLVMIYPGAVLLARRLHDMGRSGWPVLVPAVLLAAVGWYALYDPEAEVRTVLNLAAIAVAAGFVLWGFAGGSRAEPAAA